MASVKGNNTSAVRSRPLHSSFPRIDGAKGSRAKNWWRVICLSISLIGVPLLAFDKGKKKNHIDSIGEISGAGLHCLEEYL